MAGVLKITSLKLESDIFIPALFTIQKAFQITVYPYFLADEQIHVFLAYRRGAVEYERYVIKALVISFVIEHVLRTAFIEIAVGPDITERLFTDLVPLVQNNISVCFRTFGMTIILIFLNTSGKT